MWKLMFTSLDLTTTLCLFVPILLASLLKIIKTEFELHSKSMYIY